MEFPVERPNFLFRCTPHLLKNLKLWLRPNLSPMTSWLTNRRVSDEPACVWPVPTPARLNLTPYPGSGIQQMTVLWMTPTPLPGSGLALHEAKFSRTEQISPGEQTRLLKCSCRCPIRVLAPASAKLPLNDSFITPRTWKCTASEN